MAMDAGLFVLWPGNKSSDGSNVFLRETLIYQNPYLYYAFMVLDLLLRFLWTMSLVPEALDLFGPGFSICLASLEILRRAMWGIFKVEWEHLKFSSKNAVGFTLHDITRLPSQINQMESSVSGLCRSEGNTNDTESGMRSTDPRDSSFTFEMHEVFRSATDSIYIGEDDDDDDPRHPDHISLRYTTVGKRQ